MKLKSCLYNSCCCVTIFLGLLLIVVQLVYLQGLIRVQAQQGIIMTNQTHSLWGIIPGDTETFTLRNFTVFNLTNPTQFIYKQSVTPKFTEIGGFLYQQKSQFINYFYSENQTKVNFDYWLYFDLLPQSKDVNTKFNVINVAPLGFWMQLDSTHITSFAIQGFGGLFVQMNGTIKTQAIGQGVSSTFLQTYDVFVLICNNLAIQERTCWHLWNDRYYGLNNQANLQFWVKAAYHRDQQTKQCLFQYFYPIPVNQFQGILEQIRQLSEAVNQILQNWFCPQQQVCDSYKFTLKQLSAAGITNNPPPGSDPAQSICTTNSTCVGSPQIVTFLHHEFKQKYPQQKYQSLTFSEQTFKTLFTPYQGLLNIGTLNQIFQNGQQYDKNKKEQNLNELTQIFNAESNDHAFVIWEWIKYMTNQFVLKKSRGGSRKIAGLGGVFSQAWYQSAYGFADWFLKDVYSFLAYQQIGNKCTQILNFLPAVTATRICSQNIIDPNNYTYFYNLIEPCLNLSKFYAFRAKFSINSLNMQQYCDVDETPSNIGLIALNILNKVKQHYNCVQSLPLNKCTQQDIIIKQLFNSTITLNPLNIKQYHFYNKPKKTVNQWNPDLPTFQYKYFLEISGIDDVQQHIQSEARDLFTFDKLLNGPQVQQLFILDNDVEFYHKYHWINPIYLRNYIRFIVLQVGFGGFTQTRSPKQIFFGYDDPFLKNLKQTDTLSGGDPSINSFIAFNQLNMTQQQAKINKQVMFTGREYTKKTRQYVSLFDKLYITINSTYFDGKQVKWQMVSPWAQNVQLQGSDGFSIPPNSDKDQSPPVYISSIARFAGVSYRKTLTKFDMQLRDLRINENALQSKQENPQNAKYYQDFHGFLNSSYQGFPLFISKNHFLDAQPKWAQLVNIVDQNGNIMTANDWDDTRLYVEPYTGAVFSATIYLQSNYYYRADDILFPSSQHFRKAKTIQNRMLPIVNTFRSGNISENGVDKYFGDLRDILNNRRKVALTGWMIIGLSVLIILTIKVIEKNQQKGIRNQNSKSSLLQSQAYES